MNVQASVQTAQAPGLEPAGTGQPRAAASPTRHHRYTARWRRLWPGMLLALVLMVVLAAAALAALLVAAVQSPDRGPWAGHGEVLMQQLSRVLTDLHHEATALWPWLDDVNWQWSFDSISVGGLTLALALLFVGLVLVVLGALVVLPFVVLASLAAALVATLGATLLALVLAAGAFSPVWLPFAAWWWIRKKRALASAVPAAANA